MVAKARPKSEFDIFLKIWQRQKLTAPLAKGILKLGFTDEETERVSELRALNSAGSINPKELAELHAYVEAGMKIAILQSKARMFLKAKRTKTDNA